MKKLVILLLTFLFFSKIYSQEKGYIIKDGIYQQGYIFDRTDFRNMQSCVFKADKDSEPKIYSPEQISEFGYIKQNKVFVSHEITINGQSIRVFLKKMTFQNKDVLIYENRSGKYYFTIENGILTEANSSEYLYAKKEQSKENLNTFFSNSNFGIKGGLNYGKLKTNFKNILNNKVNRTMIEDDYNLSAGLFFYFPFKNYENWYVNFELNFAKHNYNLNEALDETSTIFYTYKSSFNSLNLPISLKYNLGISDFNILFNLGGIISYRFIDDNVFKKKLSIVTTIIDDNYMNKTSLGINYGIGINYKRFTLEFQQNRYYENDLKYFENTISIGYIISKQN